MKSAKYSPPPLAKTVSLHSTRSRLVVCCAVGAHVKKNLSKDCFAAPNNTALCGFQFDFPFVSVHRVKAFKFRPLSEDTEDTHDPSDTKSDGQLRLRSKVREIVM